MRQTWIFLLIVAGVAAATWYDFNPNFPLRLGLDLQGGMRVTFEADKEEALRRDIKVDARVMDQVRGVLEKRVNSFGLSGTEVRRKGEDQIVVNLPGIMNPEEAMEKISQVAQLEFRGLEQVKSVGNPAGIWNMEVDESDGTETYRFTHVESGEEVPLSEVLEASVLVMRGDQLKATSSAQINPMTTQPIVTFDMKPDGKKAFADYTIGHVNEYLAIVLDNEIISAPNINEPITQGQGEISGGFEDMPEARDLANLLNSGALPVPLLVADQQIVGATLGQESIDRSIKAGLLGLALVLLFMLLYYRLPGVIADVALLFYAAITFAIFKLGGVVLDLPGITGFILSVGMAVDANVLIFERTKEELRSGKTLHAAIDTGFNRAFTAIFDSNVTTWIVCGVLVWLGAPIIRGFAITLGIGVAVSMFTALTVTRTMLHLAVNFEWARSEKLFGLNVGWLRLIPRFRQPDQYLNIFGKRKFYLGFSALLMIASIIFIGMTPSGNGLKFDIDFTGGTVIEATFKEEVTQADVEQLLAQSEVEATAISIGRRDVTWTTISFDTEELTTQGDTPYRNALAALPSFDDGSYASESNEDGKTAQISAAFGVAYAAADITTALQASELVAKNLDVNSEALTARPAIVITSGMAPDQAAAVRRTLGSLGGGIVPGTAASTTIGPTIAREVAWNSLKSIVVASICIVLYLAIRFAIGGFVNGLKFGVCALAALLHDIGFVTGVFALMGLLLGWKINSLFVTAALTVLGYSINDTIVVYDRLRENLRHRGRGETLAIIADKSSTQTFDRSLNTSLTVMVVFVTLILFGGGSIKLFTTALLLGVMVGTYSSIFVATPLLVMWERMSAGARERAAESDVALRAAQTARRAPTPQAEPEPADEGIATEAEGEPERAAVPRAVSPPRRAKKTVKPKRKRRRQ